VQGANLAAQGLDFVREFGQLRLHLPATDVAQDGEDWRREDGQPHQADDEERNGFQEDPPLSIGPVASLR
jgi:hypothetical protein